MTCQFSNRHLLRWFSHIFPWKASFIPDFPIFPMGFQWLSIKTARLFQYFLPISPGISWRSLEVFAENPLQPKGSFHSILGPDGPGPPGPEWNDQRIYGICVSTGRNIEMQHLYICMNELCKYLRIPSKFKLDDSKICWIIKSSFRGGAKVAGFLCPAGAQRHHPCHRWIESPAHPPAISTDWLKGKGWEGFTRNNSGSSHGVLCIVPSSRSGKKMVYPWYTHGILWVQVFIIFFHRNAPELPFNRWIFENVFVVDPVDVPIFGQDMARSANLSQSIACLRDRHVQLDNLWIFCELSVA